MRPLWLLSGALLWASCGEDVAVGGREDQISQGDGDDETTDDDGTPDQCAEGHCTSGPGQDGGIASDDPIGDATGYAADDLPCETAADCCAVIDQCRSLGLVVSRKDQSTVRALIDSAEEVPCTKCGATLVQVSCESNLCVGRSVALETGIGSFDSPFAMDHCGTLETDGTAGESGHMFGCSE
jgi:hypothetical protein